MELSWRASRLPASNFSQTFIGLQTDIYRCLREAGIPREASKESSWPKDALFTRSVARPSIFHIFTISSKINFFLVKFGFNQTLSTLYILFQNFALGYS